MFALLSNRLYYVFMSEVDPAAFMLITGFGHRKAHLDPLRYELELLGHESQVSEAPLDPEATFQDHANEISDSVKGERNLVLAAFSRGINAGMRVADQVATDLVIGVCPSFDPSTTAAIGRPTAREVTTMPPKHFPGYEESITPQSDGSSMIEPTWAAINYYNRCPPEVRAWAVSLLRSQGRPANEPPLATWPVTRMAILLPTYDRQINPVYQRYVAKNWLHIKPVEIPSDHSPFASWLGELAKLLSSLSVERSRA